MNFSRRSLAVIAVLALSFALAGIAEARSSRRPEPTEPQPVSDTPLEAPADASR
jgi:hypothetical protein